MALLQASGTTIRFSDIRGMYGGNASEVRISEYFKGKTRVPDAPSSSTIPVEGNEIRFSKFYGTAKEYVIKVAATTTNYNWKTAFATAYPSPSRSTDYIARLIVNSGVTIGATATSSYALTVGAFPSAARLYIDNYGSIRGAGGAGASLADGDGLSGGPAVNADVTQTTTITVKTGGSIYGGGGGGGKGGRGGSGGKGGDYQNFTESFQTGYNTPLYFWDHYVFKPNPSGAWKFEFSVYWNSSRLTNPLSSSNTFLTNNFSNTAPALSTSPFYNSTEITVNNIKYTRGTFVSSRQPSDGDPLDLYKVRQMGTIATGGTGGTGGAGGNGGRGAGYNQTVANGDAGSTGSAGNAGGTNAGTGGTGGTGGSGGNGGGLGSAGFSGNTGNQGATGGGGGATGASGVSGTTAGSAGRSVFKNGRSTVTVTVESGAAILPAAA